MNKTEALERMDQLAKEMQADLDSFLTKKEEAQALREIIEAPEPAGSLLPSMKLQGETCYYLREAARQSFWFKTHEQRDAYASAIDTLIELRRQPGTEKPNGNRQWVIANFEEGIDVSDHYSKQLKLDMVSPCFSTEAQAQSAFEKIGADRLKQMFNCLHGVE
jgi:hypothetical protein